MTRRPGQVLDRSLRHAVLCVALAFGTPGAPCAQTAADPSTAEALRLRDGGDIAGAARILRARLHTHPDDGDAARLLAQTLYWLGERAEARALYDEALVRHPNDTAVRLDYGRMLVELLDARGARTLLTPLTTDGSARGRAATLLGLLDYWSGNLAGAVRWFSTALHADSTQPDARRYRREIAILTAPWFRVMISGRRDNQPMRQSGAEVEAGWFPVPDWSLAARVAPSRFPTGAPTTRDALDLTALTHGVVPALRLTIDGEGGVHHRSWGRASDWTGRAAAMLRVGGPWSLGVAAQRAPYLHTTRSLDSAVVTASLTGTLRLDTPGGWLGEAALGRQRFPDHNAIRTAHVWLLAPLVRGSRGILQAGYAFSMQDADETRFTLIDTTPVFPPGPATTPRRGRYDPYFTPADLEAHAVVASLVVRPSAATALRVNGAYGLRARDRAPVFMEVATVPPQGTTVVLSSYDRRFSPWDARASFEVGSAGGAAIRITAAHNRTVYYSASSLEVAVVMRMARWVMRRVDGT